MESHARRQTTDRAMMIDESERRPHSVNIITFTRVFIRTPFLPPFLSLSLSLSLSVSPVTAIDRDDCRPAV